MIQLFVYDVSLQSFVGERGCIDDMYSWLFNNAHQHFSFVVIACQEMSSSFSDTYIEITLRDELLALNFKIMFSDQILDSNRNN